MKLSLSEDEFLEFLELITFYLCMNCDLSVRRWHPMERLRVVQDRAQVHHGGALIEALRHHGHRPATEILTVLARVYAASADKKSDFEARFIDALEAPDQDSTLDCKAHEAALHFAERSQETFIIHGFEVLDLARIAIDQAFPNLGSTQIMDFVPQQGLYAVNSDTVPFRLCSSHAEKTLVGSIFSWSYCAGHLSHSAFKAKGGKLFKLDQRDHFYAQSDIPLADWTFVWDPHLLEQRRKEFSARGSSMFKFDFDFDDFRAMIDRLKACGVRLVTRKTLLQYFDTLSLLQQKLDLMGEATLLSYEPD